MKLSVHSINYGLPLPSYFEVSAAAPVYPNSGVVASPGTTEDAGRVAFLAHQTHRSARSFRAIMASHVTGFAIEGLNVTVAATVTIIVTVAATVTIIVTVAATVTVTVIIAVTAVIAITFAGHKIGAAASIHPDASPVEAPGPPRNTWRVAFLAHKADSTTRVGRAKITPPVIRSAIYIITSLGSRV